VQKRTYGRDLNVKARKGSYAKKSKTMLLVLQISKGGAVERVGKGGKAPGPRKGRLSNQHISLGRRGEKQRQSMAKGKKKKKKKKKTYATTNKDRGQSIPFPLN